MKYLDEYRDGRLAGKIVDEIHRSQTRPWVIMEVCGGQTHSIVKYGIDYLLPQRHRAGARTGLPGLRHAAGNDRQGARYCAPARRDLLLVRRHAARARFGWRSVQLKSQGGDVRVVYSPLDCLKIARANPDKKVVFFAIGFETTAPANAMAVWQAQQQGVKNFSILVSHVLVPPAIDRDTAVAREPGAGIPRARPRVRGHGLPRI